MKERYIINKPTRIEQTLITQYIVEKIDPVLEMFEKSMIETDEMLIVSSITPNVIMKTPPIRSPQV